MNELFAHHTKHHVEHRHREAYWWQHPAVWRLLCSKPWMACDGTRWSECSKMQRNSGENMQL